MAVNGGTARRSWTGSASAWAESFRMTLTQRLNPRCANPKRRDTAMATAKRKRKSTRRPNKRMTVTVTFHREHAQALREIARLAGVSVSVVGSVLLALGALRETAKMRAAGKLP